MKVYHKQVWLTSALTDTEAQHALVLCYSLKRSFTACRVAVVASARIDRQIRKAMNAAFDLVFLLEEDRMPDTLCLEEYAKLAGIGICRYFVKCCYLSPNMLALRNADDIFEMDYDDDDIRRKFEFVFKEEDPEMHFYLFKPSLDTYKRLTGDVRNGGNGESLKEWVIKTLGEQKVLRASKGFPQITAGSRTEHFLGNWNTSILLMEGDLDPLRNEQKSSLESLSMLEQKAVKHWRSIYDENVTPLLGEETFMKTVLQPTPFYKKEPVAIVGMSCRFPNCNNVGEFWDLLVEGKDGTSNPPPNRWLQSQCSRPCHDKRNVNAGFLKVPVDEFDAKFFGVSPKEAEFMDPQHRLLLEVVWEALEDASINPHSLRGSSGSVFVGSWTTDYKDILTDFGSDDFFREYMGNSIGAMTARISHFLEMTGPSIATESGCSSSMVALHLACRSLRTGETNMALAGGVNLLLNPYENDFIPYAVSPEGRCKTFSDKADGYARADGCGVLVLKRLSDAVRDGDNIWALIKGSACSQEGLSSSLGTPTAECEALAMTRAFRDAQVKPEEITYVEAHGTGTVVGDPLEVQAIAKAYHSKRRVEPLIIGSVKTNVGHTESCSGITGIMKVVLAMSHSLIPPHRNFEKLNPAIDLDAVPAKIAVVPTEWISQDCKRRMAGVSSFGITGTCTHVILEESPELFPEAFKFTKDEFERPLQILKMSAKTEDALKSYLARLQKNIASSGTANLADIGYSGNPGRANFNFRAVFTGKSTDDILSKLHQNTFPKGEVPLEKGKLCFIFTGQGSGYPGMALQLYETSPVFRLHFDHCDSLLRRKYNINLKDALWSQKNSDQLSQAVHSQLSIFVVEYALAKLWESWGVTPDYVLGHSLGEFAAAVCSKMVTLEDAIILVVTRSRLIDRLPRGKMLVVLASEEKVTSSLNNFPGPKLEIAAVNSEGQTVMAGDSDVVAKFSTFLSNTGIRSIVLGTTHAFHSRHMDPMLDNYREVCKKLQNETEVKREGLPEYISALRGRLLQKDEMDDNYWVEHTRNRVSFMNASKSAAELGCSTFIEIGPQPVLSAFVMASAQKSVVCLPSLKKNEDEWTTLLSSLGKLYLQGVRIDWEGFDRFYTRQKARVLPHYPFIGRRFWPEKVVRTAAAIHPLLGSPVPNATSLKLFKSTMAISSNEYLKGYIIGDNVLFPGTAFLEMCLAAGMVSVDPSAASLANPSRPVKIQNFTIDVPLQLRPSKTSQIHTVAEFCPSDNDNGEWLGDVKVEIYQKLESEQDKVRISPWILHAKGAVSNIPTSTEMQIPDSITDNFLEKIGRNKWDEHISTQFYSDMASSGMAFGALFQSLKKILWSPEESSLLAEVNVPPKDEGVGSGQYVAHPVVIDAMLQSLLLFRKVKGNLMEGSIFLPARVGKFVWLSKNTTDKSYIAAYISDLDGEESWNAVMLDGNGKALAILSEVVFTGMTKRSLDIILETEPAPMWVEKWSPKLGPLESRLDLESCQEKNCYDDEFSMNVAMQYGVPGKNEQETISKLDRIAYLSILRSLYECGWKIPGNGGTFSGKKLFKELGIEEKFQRLFNCYMGILQEEGLIKKDSSDIGNDKFYVTGVAPTVQEISGILSDPNLTQNLEKEFPLHNVLCKRMGTSLSKVLKGELSSLPILFQGDDVNHFYEEYYKLIGLQRMFTDVLSKWLQHCQNNSGEEKFVLRILEIGAGTGNLTTLLIDLLDKFGIEFEYTFTDISPSFFSAAKKRFEKHSASMHFRKLDLEEDPLTQGFIPEYYDYICALDVVHATKYLSQSLQNLRQLLKPLGRLDMLEMTTVNRVIILLFGVVDGLWRFEDFELRSNDCTLTPQNWKLTVESCGLETARIFTCSNVDHSLICCQRRHEDVAGIPASQKSWLLFHEDDHPISGFLLESIPKSTGRDVVVVRSGESFKVSGDGVTIRKNSEEDFWSLMEHFRKREIFFEGILYCWTLLDGKETSLEPYFYMIKCISLLNQEVAPRLITLFDGITPVEEAKLGKIGASTVWGMAKCFSSEKSEIECRSIDIGGCGGNEEKMKQIFYEIWNWEEKDPQVAYLDRTRYMPKMEQLKVEGAMGSRLSGPIFPPDQTYLIVGASDGVGLEVCKWMVEKGARYVVLAGEKSLKDNFSRAISRLKTDKEAKLMAVEVDTGNRSQFEELIQNKIPKTEYPPLKGVIICDDNVSDGEIIQNQSWSDISSKIGANVDSAWILHELTKDSSLDHFLLFSSVAAQLGAPGRGSNSAGNNFRSALVQHRLSLGLPATVINWASWIQVDSQTSAELSGLKPLSNRQAFYALEDALLHQRSHLSVGGIESYPLLCKSCPSTTSYLDETLWKSGSGEGDSSSCDATKSAEFWLTYDSQTDITSKLNQMKDHVTAILRAVLKMDLTEAVNEEQNFRELGADSLMTIEIRTALQALFGDRVEVDATLMKDNTNIQNLSDALVNLAEAKEEN